MTTSVAARHRLRITPGDAGTRLDRFLALALPALSRSRLKALILAGQVSLGGVTITDPAYRVKPGQIVDLSVPEPAEATPRGRAIPLEVIFEDAHVIVVDKPAGMVVHPAPGNLDFTLVNALIAHCGKSLSGIGGVRRPGIVHRLDKDTSGLIVAAKSDAAHSVLAAQLAARELVRAYYAVIRGTMIPASGEIAGNIGRNPANRKKMAVLPEGGKPALTRYRTLRRLGGGVASLLECRLATGRTHQIRVHLAHAGHPLIGDPLYGRGRQRQIKGLPAELGAFLARWHRQALHAYRLGFRHPATGEDLEFESPMPADMDELIERIDRLEVA